MKITMCIERAATMLTGSNLERIPVTDSELLTLSCPALMYSSLLEVTETFTDKEPRSNLKF